MKEAKFLLENYFGNCLNITENEKYYFFYVIRSGWIGFNGHFDLIKEGKRLLRFRLKKEYLKIATH